MSVCAVPRCKNTREKSQYSFYRFPVDENIRRKWISRIKIRSNYEYDYNHRICSWHFPNGKAEGPRRFDSNEGKSFNICFPAAMKVSQTKSKVHKIVPLKPLPTVKTTSSRRKQVLQAKMYSTPTKILQATSTTTKKILLDNLHVAKQELTTAKSQVTMIQSEVQDFYKEKAQLVLQIQSLTKEVFELKRDLSDENDKIKHLNLQKNNLQQQLSKFSDLHIELATTTTTNTTLEKSNTHLKKKIESFQKSYCCSTVCNKFEVEKIKKWDSKLLSSFTGFQDFSSIQLLCNILLKKMFYIIENQKL